MITGIMYFKAMRLAFDSNQKQSPGVDGANTGMGASNCGQTWLGEDPLARSLSEGRGRAATLDVADHQGQLHHDG